MGARSEQWCAPWAWLLHDQQHLSLPSWQQTVCCYFGRNSRRSIKLDGKGEPKGARRVKPVKYTAAKLHEKGVLLGIDDLQTNQWVRLGICTEHTRPLIAPIKPDSHSSVSCGLWRELHLVCQGVPLITDDRGKHVYCHLVFPWGLEHLVPWAVWSADQVIVFPMACPVRLGLPASPFPPKNWVIQWE